MYIRKIISQTTKKNNCCLGKKNVKAINKLTIHVDKSIGMKITKMLYLKQLGYITAF